MPTKRTSLGLIFALSTALLCLVTPASAASFDFSYDFGSRIFSGSFDGTQSGNLVTDVSNVTLFENGVSVGAPIYAGHYSGGSYQAGGTVFSFDGSANNIALFNVDYFTTYSFSSSNAYLIQAPEIGSSIHWYNSANGGNEVFTLSHWSLAETNHGVPDGGATVAMLGGAVLAFAALRRKFIRA